ncbi:MAG: hypothetical protein AVDCRST_MAG33-230, partial [uncultured Thermomicrobiales bacterium]
GSAAIIRSERRPRPRDRRLLAAGLRGHDDPASGSGDGSRARQHLR